MSFQFNLIRHFDTVIIIIIIHDFLSGEIRYLRSLNLIQLLYNLILLGKIREKVYTIII
jgi:hypothetical protein